MNNVMNDFSRQVNIFKPEEFKTPINIIGVGATGSWIALSLAKMGIENLFIYDFDEVGMHNLPNQCFTLRDINNNKAKSMRNLINLFTGYKIKARDVKVEGGDVLQGIVFVLTDTMKSRQEIYYKSIKNNPNIDLMIETRMDLRGGRIYVIDPKDREQTKLYEETLYGDSESEVSACGVSQTVLPSALGITSHAIWKFLNFVNDEEIINETILDFGNEIVMTNTWKKKEKVKTKIKKNQETIRIACESIGDMKYLMELCELNGFKWANGDEPLNGIEYWYTHESLTYISLKQEKILRYGDIFNAHKDDVIISLDRFKREWLE